MADQRGAVLPLVVLLAPALLALLALVADLGHLLAAQAVATAAADLGALAGVQELDLNRLVAGERHLLPASAAAHARRVAALNLARNLPRSPSRAPARVEVAVVNASPAAPGRHPFTGRPLPDPVVAVRVTAAVPLRFAPGVRPPRLTATATASVLPRRR